jgi:hypothetical protein
LLICSGRQTKTDKQGCENSFIVSRTLAFFTYNITVLQLHCNIFIKELQDMAKPTKKRKLGKWQSLIAKMPKDDSKYFPPSQVRSQMLSFYRAAKNMDRSPAMQNEGKGVRVYLDCKRGAK